MAQTTALGMEMGYLCRCGELCRIAGYYAAVVISLWGVVAMEYGYRRSDGGVVCCHGGCCIALGDSTCGNIWVCGKMGAGTLGRWNELYCKVVRRSGYYEPPD